MGRWPKFAISTADEHEKEAAKAGRIAGCCDGGNERRGTRPLPKPAKRPSANLRTRPISEYYLSACAIVRDELDLPEWVAYQFAIGFEHIHIYDNESVIPVSEVLSNWIKDGKVSVSQVKGRKMQNRCYTDYLEKNLSKWASFVDIDEFILHHYQDDLKKVLATFEQYGGLGISWQVFGDNSIDRRPDKLVVESYTKKGPKCFGTHGCKDKAQYKSIVQTEKAYRCGNPHYFAYFGDAYAVNENCIRLPSHTYAPVSIDFIQLNHYLTKSREDWEYKLKRFGAASGRPRREKDWDMVHKACNQFEDLGIQRHIPAVKALMEQYR